MKKLLCLMIMLMISNSSFAQESKTKTKSNTYEQHRSAETGRYVKKSKTKKSPSTTYTTKRKKG